MPQTPLQRRRNRAVASGYTFIPIDFKWMCDRTDRIGVVCEGDSWFSYAHDFLPSKNVVDFIQERIDYTDSTNLLRLAWVGDLATEMLEGKERKRLLRVLKNNSDAVNFILFSGGGNDIVGKHLPPLLHENGRDATTVREALDFDRFDARLTEIMEAYRDLVAIRDEHAPDAVIVTHSYDMAAPSGIGFEFGPIKIPAWIKPPLDQAEIPENLHQPIIDHMLTRFRENLEGLAQEVRDFVVVETQGTLNQGDPAHWENELHPTDVGFELITERIYAAMREIEPDLPPW